MSEYLPKWHRELELFGKIKPILILEGNVLDRCRYPRDGSVQKGTILRLCDYLHYHLRDDGYETVAVYDSIRGFQNRCDEGCVRRFGQLVGAPAVGGRISAPFTGRGVTAAAMAHSAMTQNQSASAVIFDFASRYIAAPGQLTQQEVDSFTTLLQAAMETCDVRTEQGIRKNLLILLVSKVNDLPAWFYLDNPNVKTIRLMPPTREERAMLVQGANFPSFFAADLYAEESPYYGDKSEELRRIQEKFIALTEGFTFTELNGLRRLSKNCRVSIRDLCSVVDLYRFGIRENPWNALNPEQMRQAEARFSERVKGQEEAVAKTLDVVKRAMTGLSDLRGGSGTRPKGVLFFAGPTGTGKTETAKTLAELLFGSERSCIRFDMSEYGQPHSDQRLLGAPPGYVGYEAGGQLTNAVRQNPFSILLFDEIEKAHPSVLDKFLQILEDGRMTDGQGNTVYFSETILIFTSNLGIYGLDEQGRRYQRVTAEMPCEEVRQTVRRGIEDYFKLQLGRPELLNRIGENIVVFDFIREPAAEEILRAQVEKIRKTLLETKKLRLTITEQAFRTLLGKAAENLENGGRGIGNIVESLLINPLSRYLFEEGVPESGSLTIEAFEPDSRPVTICCHR